MRFRYLLFTVALVPALLAGAPALDENESHAAYAKIENSPVSLQTLDARTRQMLFTAVVTHPVASLDVIDRYDTPKGEIGFCFGRAMTAHLMARRWGLAESSIRKLFVIGDLRQGPDPEWRFHVTTLVKGDDGRWYAIDPIMTGVLTAEQWIAYVRQTWDKPRPGKNYHAYYYVTRPSVIVPMIRTIESAILQFETFKPETTVGFSPQRLTGETVFSVDTTREGLYFINAHGAVNDRFRFSAIEIAGTRYDYRGYFWDLLADLQTRTRPNPRAVPMGTAQSVPKTTTTRAPGLYSPRFPTR